MFEQRQPLYWLLLVAFVALFARIVAGQEDWVALVLGTTLVPVAMELTCYYYSVFLLFAFLWRKSESSGAALCALSALSLLMPVIFRGADDAYTAQSVAALLYVATVIGMILSASRATETSLSGIRTDDANAPYQKSAQTERSV